QPTQAVSNRPFYKRLVPNAPAATANVTLSHLAPGAYTVAIHRTGYRANDAYSAYIDMGAPASLSPAQLAQLQSLTQDTPESQKTVTVGKTGKASLSIPMHSNDVVLLTLTPAK
ncbi:MAG: beta-xylosidase, partial [Asticcacaulis sp.]|nr:beta-xylosidase [Asticcacaulis sp.]